MGWAMMIGVAQVIGMNPTLRSFFSIAPPCANTLVALVFALDLRALERQLRVVLGLAAVAPAPASRPIESALGIEGVVEGRHGGALRRCAGGEHRHPSTN